MVFSKLRQNLRNNSSSKRSNGSSSSQRRRPFPTTSHCCDDDTVTTTTQTTTSRSTTHHSSNSQHHHRPAVALAVSALPPMTVVTRHNEEEEEQATTTPQLTSLLTNTTTSESATIADFQSLDFQIHDSIRDSWDAVKSVVDYKNRLGEQILYNMSTMEPKTCQILTGSPAASLTRPSDELAQAKKLVVRMVEDLVMVYGPDLDPLRALKPRLERKGFDFLLFAAFAQAVPQAMKAVLLEEDGDQEWTSTALQAWTKYLRCAVATLTPELSDQYHGSKAVAAAGPAVTRLFEL